MSALQQLLSHLDRLRAQHRAGVVPPFGELDELWDLVADVRGEIATAAVRPGATAENPFFISVPRDARFVQFKLTGDTSNVGGGE